MAHRAAGDAEMTTTLLGLLGDFWPYIAGALAVAGTWLAGRRSGDKRAQAKADREHIETRKEIDDATIGNDPAVADRFLLERDNGQRRRDMPWHRAGK